MFKNTIQRLVVAVLIMGMVVPPGGSARELAGEIEALPASSGLYRTRVAVRQPADWARLEKLGVVVLERTADQQKNADDEIAKSVSFRKSAVILADADQLETLACLRFEPRGTDERGVAAW